MEKLPYEVLSEIFMRLLAKQLAQMRCVCKPWNTLLSESFFIKSHLHHSIENNDGILLFFHMGFSFDRNPFAAYPSRSPGLELSNFIKLPTNLQSHGNVIGSVNGLICFKYGSYDDYAFHIWNPSLSVVSTLPPCSLPMGDTIKNHFRFGYDPKTDDYKVVKLKSLSYATTMLTEVEVYSMRKGSWEVITERLPLHIKHVSYQDDVCVDGHDGHLHWLGYADLEWKQVSIVAFDLGAETFREIPLPDSVYHEDCFNVLGFLTGKLCVMSCVTEGGKCEVWVMDEYGVAESWVKHHTFSQFSSDITQYGFTSRGEFLFQVDDGDNDCFALHDPIASKTKTFKIMGRNYNISKIVEYVDSLVWIEPVNRLQI